MFDLAEKLGKSTAMLSAVETEGQNDNGEMRGVGFAPRQSRKHEPLAAAKMRRAAIPAASGAKQRFLATIGSASSPGVA